MLASPAITQVKWLDDTFHDLTGGESAEGYGNNELILEFDGIAAATDHMIECGELKQSEARTIDKINQLLNEISPSGDKLFWRREALHKDPRWERIRVCAAEAYEQLPNELRESDWTRSNWGPRN